VRPGGAIRVTIPGGGSRREAEVFFNKHRSWIEREQVRVAAQYAPSEWREGDEILLHGVAVRLRVERGARSWMLVVGDQRVRVASDVADLRPAAETALRHIARRELIPKLERLAQRYKLPLTRTLIRNQRSRWGSCSRAGVVALNFRLVQMPPVVCEYVLLHELMHLQYHNHSKKYWRLVEAVCPDYRDSERWLRTEGKSLF